MAYQNAAGLCYGGCVTAVREQAFITQDATDRRPADREVELAQLPDDAAVTPAEVLFGKADDESAPQRTDAWPSRRSGTLAGTLFPDPTTIGLVRDDTEDVLDVVVQFASDAEQLSAVSRAKDDAVPVQLAAEHLDLGAQEADSVIATSAEALEQEVQNDVEPA